MTKKFIGLSVIIVLVRLCSIVIQNLLAVDVEDMINNYRLLSQSSLVIYLASITVPLLYIAFLKKRRVIQNFSVALILYYTLVQIPIFIVYSIAVQHEFIVQSIVWNIILIAINIVAVIGLFWYMIRLKNNTFINQTLYIIMLMFLVGVVVQNPMPAFFIEDDTFASYYYVLVSGFAFVVLYCSVVIIYIHEKMDSNETR